MKGPTSNDVWNTEVLQQVYKNFEKIGFVTACMNCRKQTI